MWQLSSGSGAVPTERSVLGSSQELQSQPALASEDSTRASNRQRVVPEGILSPDKAKECTLDIPDYLCKSFKKLRQLDT